MPGAGPVGGAARPDVGFTLAGPADEPDSDELIGDGGLIVPGELPFDPDLTPEEQSRQVAVRLAHALGELGPPGWRELAAVFALTVAFGGGQVRYVDAAGEVVHASPPAHILELALAQRRLSAGVGDGPWWRLLLRMDADGEVEIDYDYGTEPFPDEHLFAVDAYLADLAEFPREELPMWLSAYLFHDGRQQRAPAIAARQARADRAAGIHAVALDEVLPDLPAVWVRWTVLSAAFVAVGSEWGPRILPSFGWFEGAQRSGATLYLLPRSRAVLSGGVWNAAELVAGYQDGGELPPVFAGAPSWVTEQVLNSRAATGLVSFCYWWSEDRWYRGGTEGSERLDEAVPGIWSDDAVERLVRTLAGDPPPEPVAALLVAAYEGVVTRAHLLAVFGADADIDSALHQLTMSGAAHIEEP